MWLPFLFIGLAGIGLQIALDAVGNKDLVGFACVASALAFLVWLIIALIIQAMMIKPTEITERTISLKCVHDDFAGAMRDMEDDYERGPRRRRYDDDDDYDDRPRRPQSRADDDDAPRRRDDRTGIRPERDFE